jgi:B12-binding domain/radical SAM domain protein
MKRKTTLAFYYEKQNRYGINALAGSLDEDPYFDNLSILFSLTEEELLSNIEASVPDNEVTIVAFSFATTQTGRIGKIVGILRERFGRRLLCLAGGPHPTGEPAETLAMGFDVVVCGEGETTLIDLLKGIDTGEDWDRVPGIAFKAGNGDCHFTGKRPPVTLDQYPPFPVKRNKAGPIEITRGCPFHCHFCQIPHIFPGRIRHRSAENVCTYVEAMKHRGLDDVRFITPNAFSYASADGKKVNLAGVEDLLRKTREIVKPDGQVFFGSFPSEVRPEHVTDETIGLVLQYGDNDNLVIGAQSGSPRILDLCRRGHNVEDIYRAVELTVKAGLVANVDFIFGLPGEDEEDIGQTIRLLRDVVAMGARIHAHRFLPLPQTPFAAAPPGRISRDLRRVIRELNQKRAIYGNWA